MLQALEELDLTLEASAEALLVGDVRGEDLDGDVILVVQVKRLEDARHPTLADLLQDMVRAERFSDQSEHSTNLSARAQTPGATQTNRARWTPPVIPGASRRFD